MKRALLVLTLAISAGGHRIGAQPLFTDSLPKESSRSAAPG